MSDSLQEQFEAEALTIEQASRIIGRGWWHTRHLMVSGRLDHVRLPDGRRVPLRSACERMAAKLADDAERR